MTQNESRALMLLATLGMTNRERVASSLNLSLKSLTTVVDEMMEIATRNPGILRVPEGTPDERILSCCLNDYHKYLALRDEIKQRENRISNPTEPYYQSASEDCPYSPNLQSSFPYLDF